MGTLTPSDTTAALLEAGALPAALATSTRLGANPATASELLMGKVRFLRCGKRFWWCQHRLCWAEDSFEGALSRRTLLKPRPSAALFLCSTAGRVRRCHPCGPSRSTNAHAQQTVLLRSSGALSANVHGLTGCRHCTCWQMGNNEVFYTSTELTPVWKSTICVS